MCVHTLIWCGWLVGSSCSLCIRVCLPLCVCCRTDSASAQRFDSPSEEIWVVWHGWWCVGGKNLHSVPGLGGWCTPGGCPTLVCVTPPSRPAPPRSPTPGGHYSPMIYTSALCTLVPYQVTGELWTPKGSLRAKSGGCHHFGPRPGFEPHPARLFFFRPPPPPAVL